MRVKVRNKWFEATETQSIMIELTEKDKENIANMLPKCKKYAIFDDKDTRSVEEKYLWMDEDHGVRYVVEDTIDRRTVWAEHSKSKNVTIGAVPVMAHPLFDNKTNRLVGITWNKYISGVTHSPELALLLSEFIEMKRAHSEVAYDDEHFTDILEHAEHEIQEIRETPDNIEEWVDLALLAMDGAWRCARWKDNPHSHHSGETVAKVFLNKLHILMERFKVESFQNTILPDLNIPMQLDIDDHNRTIDSTANTLKHRHQVQSALNLIISDLIHRGLKHDQSKLEEPEKSALDRFEYLNVVKGPAPFGSEEYKWRTSLLETKHHFANNRHHPQYFEYGINDMNLSDIVEMLCDWRAASHRDGDKPCIHLSASCDHFSISNQLRFILENTCRQLDWDFK